VPHLVDAARQRIAGADFSHQQQVGNFDLVLHAAGGAAAV